MIIRVITVLGLILMCVTGSPVAAQQDAASLYRSSGLPIPRFVSLRSEKVFVRTGPALRYPIKWVFQKEGLPVEVIQEFDTWRKIRDAQGEEGWIHQSLLSGTRGAIITSEMPAAMRRQPEAEAQMVAWLEPGVVGELQACLGNWCEVSAEGYSGWVERNSLWGIYAAEEFN